MPIKKFTSFKDASEDLWVFDTNKDYFDSVKNNFEFWSKLSNRKIKKGIQKFTTYDEFIKTKNKQFN